MANVNVAFGFKPIKQAGSTPHSGGLSMYYHPASDGTALYIGDPVVKTGSADAAGIAGCKIAVAGAAITGIVQGFVPDGVVDVAGYGAASTAYYVLVADDPDMAFEVQEDAVGGAIAAADIGLNASFIAAAGNAYTKRSGAMLDTSTKATTAGLELKIVGLVPRPNNDLSANAKVIVKINNHSEAQASAGL